MGRFEEIQKEGFSSWADNGKACEGCMFAEENPYKCSCMIYANNQHLKPDSVYLDGDTCKYYRSYGKENSNVKSSKE